MPLVVQSGDVVLHNGTVASATLGCEHVEVIVPTIWFALTLMEALLAELLAALGTEEMFGVPRLLQSRHTFLERQTETKEPVL